MSWRARGLVLGTIVILAGAALPAPVPAVPGDTGPVTVEVFRGDVVRFAPGASHRSTTTGVVAHDGGREIIRTVDLTPPAGPSRVFLRVSTAPVPADPTSVHDRWDRAGNVRLISPGRPDLELMRFVTAYGGRTEHEVEITDLASLLRGPVTLAAFVDTWVDSAWMIDVSIRFAPDSLAHPADWVHPLFYSAAVTESTMAAGPLAASVTVPPGISRIDLNYLSTGHCTDGIDADEFVSKDNVIRVDGIEALRYRPWRSDCRDFRAVNPYCRRWSDGTWSVDFSRSGWCPGDWVAPVRTDLSRILPAGDHTVEAAVEDVRPRDAGGNYGYWRVSAYLTGWRGGD